jgi:hypothetical protein
MYPDPLFSASANLAGIQKALVTIAGSFERSLSAGILAVILDSRSSYSTADNGIFANATMSATWSLCHRAYAINPILKIKRLPN